MFIQGSRGAVSTLRTPRPSNNLPTLPTQPEAKLAPQTFSVVNQTTPDDPREVSDTISSRPESSKHEIVLRTSPTDLIDEVWIREGLRDSQDLVILEQPS